MTFTDLINGRLKINNSFFFDKDDNYFNVIEKLQSKSYEIWDVKNGYKWIYFKNVNINNHFFNLNLCFYDYDIVSLELRHKEWCEYDNNTAFKYEEILTEFLGNIRIFNRATIKIIQEPVMGTAFIKIKYN